MRSRRTRILMWVLGTVLVLLLVFLFVVAPYVVANFLTTLGTRPMESGLTTTPADFGVSYEEVSFLSTDGVPLKGWYLGGGRRNVSVVCAQGLFRSRRELLERGVFLRRAGFNVLLFDFRRHGESGGDRTSIGFKERLDVRGAVSLVKEKSPRDRVVLYGVSMGAAAVLMAAAETDEVEAVIADSCFLSLENVVVHHLKLFFGLPRFPFGDELLFFIERLAGFRREELDLERAVTRIGNRPILFVAGGADRRIPVDVQQQLYRAARSPLSRFVIVEGATHGAAYRTNTELYQRVLTDFLEEILEQPPPG